MAAFFIAQVKLKNGEKFQAYAAQTKAIFADYGAELITRGKAMGSIAGDVTHDAVAVMKFPDMQKLEAAFATGRPDGYECSGTAPFTEDAWYQCRVVPNLRDSAALKVEYQHVRLDDRSAGRFANLQAGWQPGGNADLVSIALDFLF